MADPRKLDAARGGLDARQRAILELRYGLGELRPRTLRQIGRRFGISGERVRQIEQQALHRLGVSDGMPARGPAGAPQQARASETLPRVALEALVLVLLRDRPAHGYDLVARLERPGDRVAPRLYRLLRDLERDGVLRSRWTESSTGPERRVYRLTNKGTRRLDDDAQALQGLAETLKRFFEHYAHVPEKP